jgi:tripartite-type tricarboxylate transporter receptor subunit TctC
VPYKGAAPQIADVAGKHITMTFVSIGAALPFITSNRIRPIGVTSLTRVSVLPDVPAIAETPALAGFELVNFFGFFGPAGMPDPILRRLNAAAVQTLKMPEIATRLKGMGFEPAPTTPEQFRQFIRSESAKFAKVIVEANIKVEQ